MSGMSRSHQFYVWKELELRRLVGCFSLPPKTGGWEPKSQPWQLVTEGGDLLAGRVSISREQGAGRPGVRAQGRLCEARHLFQTPEKREVRPQATQGVINVKWGKRGEWFLTITSWPHSVMHFERKRRFGTEPFSSKQSCFSRAVVVGPK